MDAPSGDVAWTLPDYLKARRKELRLGQAEAARRAGVGRMAWFEWENGRRAPRDSNYAGIDIAMEWQRGGVESIRAGGKPRIIPKEDRGPNEITEDEIEDALAVMRAGLRRLYPPAEVDRRIAREREEITEAQKARARQQRQAG